MLFMRPDTLNNHRGIGRVELPRQTDELAAYLEQSTGCHKAGSARADCGLLFFCDRTVNAEIGMRHVAVSPELEGKTRNAF